MGTPALKVQSSDATDGTTATIASATYTANRLILVAVTVVRATGSTAEKPSISGLGATWTERGDVSFGGSSRFRTTLYSTTLASNQTGTIGISVVSTHEHFLWQVVEYDDASTFVQGVSVNDGGAAVTTLTATLAAFSHVNNGAISFMAHAGSAGTVTPGTGWTELGEYSDGRTIQAQWRADNDTTADVSWVGAQRAGMIALEVAPASTTVSGTVAYTEANDTVAAAGSSTTGTVAYTEANDTVAAAGSSSSSATGTIAYTEENDTVAAAGSTSVPSPAGLVTGYKFLAYDLVTRTKLAELPLLDVSYSEVLNGAGEFSATLPIGDLDTSKKRVQAALYELASKPRRTALFIERDGQIVWGGIIWRRDYVGTRKEYALQGAQYWSIFHHRLITNTKTYTQQDQTSGIVSDLITYAQSKTGAALSVTQNTPASGVLRDATYWYYEVKSVAQVIEQMTDNNNGFDFALICAYDTSGAIVTRFETYYPERGQHAIVTSQVFEYGKNVIDFTWPEDGWASSNSVFLIGAGEAESMLRATQTDVGQLGTFPLLESSYSYKDVSIQQTLDDHARSRLKDKKDDLVSPQIFVRGGGDPSLGGYIPGDEIRFRVPVFVQDPRFPDGYDGVHRIASITVKVPNDQSEETVILSFTEPT